MADEKKRESLDAAQFPVGGGVVGPETPDGDEPMTDKQAAQLRELCETHDEPFDGNMTRDQADARIEALGKS